LSYPGTPEHRRDALEIAVPFGETTMRRGRGIALVYDIGRNGGGD
jgi:hypothetical protein